MASKTPRTQVSTRTLLRRYAAAHELKTQGQLARALGVTRQSISLLVKGQRVMGTETALKICRALELNAADVLEQLQAERATRVPKPGATDGRREIVMHSAPSQVRGTVRRLS